MSRARRTPTAGRATLRPEGPGRLQARDNRARRGPAPVAAPSWAQVEAALLALDGARFDDLSLEFGSGPARTALLVSGGREGRVVCCIARPDDPRWEQDFNHLVEPERGEEPFAQSIGGQESDLPGLLSVVRAKALRAARYFLAHRAEDPGLDWQVPE